MATFFYAKLKEIGISFLATVGICYIFTRASRTFGASHIAIQSLRSFMRRSILFII
nr:hypothetical protein [Cressdnaviricota sp.]UOF80771.1 hypothetical protein [Cressdnaviricota sp.]